LKNVPITVHYGGNFIRTLNTVIAKYPVSGKPKGGKGGEQTEQNNSSSNQPNGGSNEN